MFLHVISEKYFAESTLTMADIVVWTLESVERVCFKFPGERFCHELAKLDYI